ncbi:hypothetical protein [Marinomonas sp. 2405UD68-3]|uniref:hypothetical protein n=1 Tax=Marinomonas sp. 2405UD68-3 TaxID=3391835 RepID=UPI0039C97683
MFSLKTTTLKPSFLCLFTALLPIWGTVLYVSTWLLPDHVFWSVFGFFLLISIFYIKWCWLASVVAIGLDADGAYVLVGNALDKHRLYFEQYGNLCLHAWYDKKKDVTSLETPINVEALSADQTAPTTLKYVKKVIKEYFPLGRKRLLIARDSLPLTEYRTLQSFAAREVRLKMHKAHD